jgi:hypothetical protein
VVSLKFVPHFSKRKPGFINGFQALTYTSYLRDRTLVATCPVSRRNIKGRPFWSRFLSVELEPLQKGTPL